MNKQKDNFDVLKKIIIGVFVSIYIVITYFLLRWQVFEHDKFEKIASQRYKERSIPSIRGDILARDGTTLAYSEIRYDVFVYLDDLKAAETKTINHPPRQTREEFITKVSTLLGVSSDEIEQKLNSGPRWIKIASQIDIKTKNNLEKIPSDRNEKLYLSGLNFEFNPKRVYPEGHLASHVLGFLGKDLNSNDIGRGGLEQKYDGTLEPQEGYVAGETDQFGNLIAISDSVSIRAKRGSTLETTIDPVLQEIAERKIKEGVERYEGKSGSILILDPKTGEVLAMASYPDFAPQEYFKEKTSDVFTNPIISIPYEVGSIAKLFTLSAAVEELDIKGNDIISTGHNGCRDIVASNPKDIHKICTADKKPQGAMTTTQALIASDNLAFVNLGDRLGKVIFEKYLRNFGVGTPTEIDLSGESIGYLPDINDPSHWHPVDVAVFSFGHGYQMNLLQAIRGIAAIDNNGWLMQPYIVSKIIDANGNTKTFNPIQIRKVITEDTAKKVILMMEELYKTTTDGQYSYLRNYPVAAKSGTALIPYKDRAGYSDDVNATYVGFDTSENRKFIMAVKIEAPQNVIKLSYYSARPIWLEAYSEIKDHLNIKPNEK